MERMKVTTSFSMGLFSGPTVNVATQEQLSRGKLGFSNKIDHVPTPPMSPTSSSVNEYEVVQIPSEYVSTLSKGLGALENHLERNPKMARSAQVLSELKYMIGKDRTGLEILASLTSLIEACAPSNIPSTM